MALTNQPYLPLYVDDWMNNNKLKLCSPAAHGVMVSVMCIMHKESEYGKLLLKQKFKQTTKQPENFALQIAKQSSFDLHEILPGLEELISEKVLKIEGEYLVCTRMVEDAKISLERSKAGFKGGKTTQFKSKKFAKAKKQANTVNGNVIENVNEDLNIIKNAFLKFFESENFEQTWKDFDEMRKELKSPLSLKAAKLILKKLERLSSGNPETAILIIEQSIENSWKGVFEIKGNKQGSYTVPQSKSLSLLEQDAELRRRNEL